MNNLNNSQVVLLTLLVSFVTSIATGIFTVVLMENAPQSIATQVERVVEKTVEVVTEPVLQETVVREKVVIDQPEEMIIGVIRDSSPAVNMVEVKSTQPTETGAEEIITYQKLGTGVFISPQGFLVSLVDSDVFNVNDSYTLRIADGEGIVRVPLELRSFDTKKGLVLFVPTGIPTQQEAGQDGSVSDEEAYMWPFIPLSKDGVAVGQRAIVLDAGAVAVSFISGVFRGDKGQYYRLSLDEGDELIGSPVINVKKELVGLLDRGNRLVTAEAIHDFFAETLQEGHDSVDSGDDLESDASENNTVGKKTEEVEPASYEQATGG